MDIKFVAIAFVDAINTRDKQALAQLMVTPCLLDNHHAAPLPDYRIKVERIITDCDTVVLTGQAISCYGSVPAVWIAQICGRHITEWQAYFDGHLACNN